jgi:CBS domain-containing protein
VIAYNIHNLDEALEMPVMTANIARLPLIDPREDCGNALYLMRELGTGGFAVVDSSGIIGIITERDLVKGIYGKKGIGFFSDLFLKSRETILA